MTLTCYCCGETYRRGELFCCRPQRHMRSDKWLEKHCQSCRRCPRHCACAKPEPAQYSEYDSLMSAVKVVATKAAI